MGIIKNDKSNVLAECKCEVCGNEWDSIREQPKCCPACKRYDWNGAIYKTTSSEPSLVTPSEQQV